MRSEIGFERKRSAFVCSEYHTIVKRCCGGCMETCDLSNITNSWCEETVGDALVQVWMGGLNPYDVYRTCYHNPALGKSLRSVTLRNSLLNRQNNCLQRLSGAS